MANDIRLKRRWIGAAGAPGSLLSGEPAFNGVDNIFYLGFGDDGQGNATSIQAIGGAGAFLALTGTQQVRGVKTFIDGVNVQTQLLTDDSGRAASTAFVQGLVNSIKGTVSDGDKGEITVTGGVWNIDAGAVTLAKMAPLPASTFIGNKTGASGTPTALTASEVKTVLSLSNVENTALSTWVGTDKITTLGTITVGTWQGTSIAATKGGTGRTNLFTPKAIQFAANANTLADIAVANSAVLVTGADGTPELATDLPAHLTIPAVRRKVSTSVAAAIPPNALPDDADVCVISVADADSGVRLPLLAMGKVLTIFNDALNTVTVYPAAGEQIDQLGPDQHILVNAGSSVVLTAVSATTWNSSYKQALAAINLRGMIPVSSLPVFGGDVTAASGSNTLTIGNGKVTLSKLAPIPAGTVLANTGATAAAPAALPVSDLKALLGVSKEDLGLDLVDNTADVDKPISLATQEALDDKLNASLLAVANGVAPLDANAKIPAVHLPSFVDDVLEFANLAAFPTPGETGKIYTALDTNKIYRWSGSTYVEISGSPGSTDAVPEGAANLYHTDARARAAVITQDIPAGATNLAPSAGAVKTALAAKLDASNNLAALADKAASRTNLGLKSMAVQDASNVAITGGTIDGITLDGGTF